MSSYAEAQKAIQQLDGHHLGGPPLKIRAARDPENRGNAGGRNHRQSIPNERLLAR